MKDEESIGARFKVENNGIIDTLFNLIFSVFDEKGQLRMDNPDTGNIEYTRHRTKTNKTQHNTENWRVTRTPPQTGVKGLNTKTQHNTENWNDE